MHIWLIKFMMIINEHQNSIGQVDQLIRLFNSISSASKTVSSRFLLRPNPFQMSYYFSPDNHVKTDHPRIMQCLADWLFLQGTVNQDEHNQGVWSENVSSPMGASALSPINIIFMESQLTWTSEPPLLDRELERRLTSKFLSCCTPSIN